MVPKEERIVANYVFASSWLTLIVVAAMGAYPTPIVGYGASAIIGYFLSLIFLQSKPLERLAGGDVRTDVSDTEEALPPLRSSAPALAL